MSEPTTELLALIVKALEPYDIPTVAWSTKEREEPARAVLTALGDLVAARTAIASIATIANGSQSWDEVEFILASQEAPTLHPDGTVCPERPGWPCPVCAMTEAGA